ALSFTTRLRPGWTRRTPRHPAGSVRQTRLRLNKQPPIDGQVTRNCSRSLEADCEDNVKSAIGGQCDEQVAQVGGALHAVVAQWVHVAQSRSEYLRRKAIFSNRGSVIASELASSKVSTTSHCLPS